MRRNFLKDMITNPDETFSTKRVAGWICLFITIVWAMLSQEDVSEGFKYVFALTCGFWGFTTADNIISRRGNSSKSNEPEEVDLK